MRKKSRRKHIHNRRSGTPPIYIVYTRYIAYLVIIVFVLFGITAVKSNTNVLGINTHSNLLAENSSDPESSGSTATGGNVSGGETQPTQVQEFHPTEPPKVEIHTEGNKTEVQAESGTTHIELKTEGDKIVIKSKTPNGETELETKSALDSLNQALKDEDIQIGTTAANGFSIKKHDVEAETHFPLSVDPTTRVLTVTTPAGSKEVTVLPDQAVQNLLNGKVLTNVESQSTPTVDNPNATTQKTTLTELNNEPVFQVNGSLRKNLLGIIPIDLARTAFVSAQTGQVVKIDEALLQQILGAISF